MFDRPPRVVRNIEMGRVASLFEGKVMDTFWKRFTGAEVTRKQRTALKCIKARARRGLGKIR
jgi:hypothetical protein